MYYKQFKDFDGTTGFDLYGKLNNKEKGVIQAIAISVLNSYRKDKISQRSWLNDINKFSSMVFSSILYLISFV